MKNWKMLLVRPKMPINEVIKVIDKGAQGIVMVTEANGVLLGTVTDGDIRRALINRIDLNNSIEKVMCSRPKTGAAHWDRVSRLVLMKNHQLLHLPIVDDFNRVIGLETLTEAMSKPQYDNPIFLIAGGFGTRLHPLTIDCPKPLLKIGEKPILELILERFIDAGFHRFYISTHFMAETIENHFKDGSQWGIDIKYIFEEKPLGTGGALGLLPHHEIDLPLIMMNGDLLTNLNFHHVLNFHEDHGGNATVCVREYKHVVPYGVIQGSGHRLLSIEEKPSYEFFISAGIYVLDPEFIKRVAPGVYLDMPNLLQSQIAEGKHVNMFPIHEYWLDIGRMDDFNRAQTEVVHL